MPSPMVDPPSLLAPAMLTDPAPAWRELRATPVGWCEPMGVWILSGWSACDAVLRHPSTRSNQFRRRHAQLQAAAEPAHHYDDLLRIVGLQMVFMNPPEHPRVRRALQAAFSPRVVETLRSAITTRVDELMAHVEPGTDLIAALAEPLPAMVVADLLGVPQADRERFVAWSHVLVEFVGTGRADAPYLDGAQEAMREWAAFFADVAAGQRGRSTVLGTLLAQLDDGALTWDELVSNAVFLLAAGHETTTNLIGNGTVALARDPEAWAQLRGDLSLVPSAVEELLRYDAPVQLLGRTTSEPVSIDGVELPADADLLLAVGAANRDPAEFPDPERLVLDRQPNRHLAFAQGPHVCLGAALARLEGREAFRALAGRFPELHVEEPLSWRPNPAFRGVNRLTLF